MFARRDQLDYCERSKRKMSWIKYDKKKKTDCDNFWTSVRLDLVQAPLICRVLSPVFPNFRFSADKNAESSSVFSMQCSPTNTRIMQWLKIA